MALKEITPTESYPALASKLGLKGLLLKREDKHPLGSHKGRSIPFMIDKAMKAGVTSFAISSSGNAGLAAVLHIVKLNNSLSKEKQIKLTVYAGENISVEKLQKIEDEAKDDVNISIVVTERPKQAVMKAEKEGVLSLRQSTNDDALLGYQTLADEISEIPNLSAIFIASSSGTSALAIYNFLNEKGLKPEIHIVQTSSCHPISEEFDIRKVPDEVSLAGAIVDKVVFRKDAVIRAIKSNSGYAWTITNEEILNAQNFISSEIKDVISPNGILSIAGLIRAKENKFQFDGNVLCIISGK